MILLILAASLKWGNLAKKHICSKSILSDFLISEANYCRKNVIVFLGRLNVKIDFWISRKWKCGFIFF